MSGLTLNFLCIPPKFSRKPVVHSSNIKTIFSYLQNVLIFLGSCFGISSLTTSILIMPILCLLIMFFKFSKSLYLNEK